MRNVPLRFLSIVLLAASGVAQAAPVGLGIAGEFNLYSLHDVNVSGSKTQGAVAAAGNLTASNYSVNTLNDGYAGNALVVGGNLSYQSGSISNGNVYVGGSRTVSSLGFSGQWMTGTAPVPFAEQAAQLMQLSTSLSTLAATGKTAVQWGGISFIGSDSGVEVFDIVGTDLAAVTYASFSHLGAGSTIILNVSGAYAGLQGGTPAGLANYNVLYNFFEATSLSFSNTAVYGSILAPLATVKGGSGQINGNVIVGDWDSGIAINDNHTFNTTEVAAFASAAPRPVGDGALAVPEPTGIALFLLALGMLGWTSRRALSYKKAPRQTFN